MPCVFCGRPFHSPAGAFCTDCLGLLAFQRAIENGRFAGKKIEHLRPVVKRGVCGFCRHEPCACRCVICGNRHADCRCSAQAILEYYGIFGGEPEGRTKPSTAPCPA